MPVRLCQEQFDENFQPDVAKDVTPAGLTELKFPPRPTDENQDQKAQSTLTDLGRFVREVQENVRITSPSDAASYLIKRVYTPFDQFDQEEVWILLLNAKSRITHEVMLYRGTINTAYIRTAEIFKEAVRVNATGLILSHCHPSGDVTPSPEDVEVTRKAREAATILSITLEDHIIVGKNEWVSLRERGLGFD